MTLCLLQLMSVVYVALTTVWIGEMLRLREHVLPVHFLCLVCVLVKAVQSILIAVYYHRQVKNTSIIRARETTTVFKIMPTRFIYVVFICSRLRSGWRACRTAASHANCSAPWFRLAVGRATEIGRVCLSPTCTLIADIEYSSSTQSRTTQEIETNLPISL